MTGRIVVVAGLAAAVTAASAVAITITPGRQDFGKTAVQGGSSRAFQVSLPTGAGPGETLTGTITGANAADFVIEAPDPQQTGTDCLDPRSGAWRSGSCDLEVTFRPTSVGIKTAALVLADSRGNRGTAALRGEGVLCTMTVVSCNYAQLYSGTFSWKITLRDRDTQTTTDVTVGVIKGVAECNGSEVETDARTGVTRGTISGPGLIGVEFLSDPMYRLVYNIVAACPTAAYPDVAVQPASLGNSASQESQKQPVSAVGVDLEGTISYPAPENDPVNGVSGTVRVIWSLKRWCTTPSGCP